jgi:PH (Pleckstrin Homology) domain-containing protein
VQVFTIAAPGARPLWILLPVAIVLAVSAAAVVAVPPGSRTARFEVSPTGLQLRGDFYGRLIRADNLVVQNMRRVDFARSTELEPKRRTVGTGLPRYQAGWFRLANGEKALLYLTDRAKAVYVPTTSDYSLIQSLRSKGVSRAL